MTIYDYVIVGAGSAGCVLANRLADATARRVGRHAPQLLAVLAQDRLDKLAAIGTRTSRKTRQLCTNVILVVLKGTGGHG
jgi:flavin-dependent dehydrogenase